MTATEKRYTAEPPESSLQGVLFLTAGYGTRAEPLSIPRPKCLLPWLDTTVLGALVRQFALLKPRMMAFNASRCPEMILEEAAACWSGKAELIFEERPLGVTGTLSAGAGLFQGTWAVCNTDFVMDLPLEEMLAAHLESGRSWTALTCSMPPGGDYRPLLIKGEPVHYAGVSFISGEVASAAAETQESGGLFSRLGRLMEERGRPMGEYRTARPWMDMGETELFRRNTLAMGRFVHPLAEVHSGAELKGFYRVGPYCIIHDGSVIRDSVLLEGAKVLPGQRVVERVLPWHYEGDPVD